jgi:alginate O-acetyltransferase complex protein AlgI
MSFSSQIFLFAFFPISVAFYYAVKNEKLQLISMILFNFGFILFTGVYSLIFILISCLLNFFLGRIISSSKSRNFLILGIIINALSLIYFKYSNFLISNLEIFGFNLGFVNILAPVGISFYTFQAIAYLIEASRIDSLKKLRFSEFLIYFTFFPKFLSGPIQPIEPFIAQVHRKSIDYTRFEMGIQRFIIGLTKKIIIADVLGTVTDQIFSLSSTDLTSLIAWLGVLTYTLQIYFDFSGYTDMAIGLSKIFGYDLMENFNLPYTSYSISEFWRRWHISLSTWFKKYIYIPLGGSRSGNVYFNLLVVFTITGIWHGANWIFVIWGLWHGLLVIVERFFKLSRKNSWVNRLITLLLVSLGWVWFRSPDFTFAIYYFKVLFNANNGNSSYYLSYFLDLRTLFTLSIGIIFSFFRYPSEYLSRTLAHHPVIFKTILLSLFVLSLIYLMNSNYNPFIYFQF